MGLENLDIPFSKFEESARNVIDQAIEEAKRHKNSVVICEHLFAAFVQLEWNKFLEFTRDFNLNPNAVCESIDKYLMSLPSLETKLSFDSSVRFALKIALHNAGKNGRQTVTSTDIFAAIFESDQGFLASILKKSGIKSDIFISSVYAKEREREVKEQKLKKKFQLPPLLNHFAANLNLLAALDKISPVYGRDKEIQQVLEALSHKERSSSVMLLGEAGVGKTAIVEGLARRIELEPGTIPARFRNCQIVNLQINSLVAGTQLRGMFEERVDNVIRELKEHPNLILFIDEAHTIVGAGSALGVPADAAQTIKSVLARGEIRMIAATTLSEYKKRIEEDEALARRFRVVIVPEPSIDETGEILNNVKSRLERNYSVRFTDEAIKTALEFASRYQRHLRLPDKPIGWLDTAAVRAELASRYEVGAGDVISVVADISGLPLDIVCRDVSDRFQNIENILSKRVVGQKDAICSVANRLRLNKGPLKDGFDRPDGVLFFMGPTGVGKTELAKALAEFLFGSDKKMIRLDMSEYQGGDVSIGKLIGTPRGIFGSENGGALTNQLRDNPYSVVLLDEIEKTTPEVLNLFLQAFDEGWLTDGRGKRVYLSDSIIIMTSNIGVKHFKKMTNPLGFQSSAAANYDDIIKEVKREFENHFSPEFRNRIDEVVVFNPLTREEVRVIAAREIEKIKNGLARLDKILDISENTLEKLVQSGYSFQYGARFLKRVIDDKIKIPVSNRIQNKIFSFVVNNGLVELVDDQEQLVAT